MLFNEAEQTGQESAKRVWRFGGCEFDEFRRVLSVHGQEVDLEAKPLDVLHHLLLHAGEVVTKDELLEWVWPGTSVVDGSVATAVSKLRRALEDDTQAIVITVPRVGYRLAVPVNWQNMAAPPVRELGLKKGDPVAGREQWQLARRLDSSGSSEVWLAEHPKTHGTRVFKFVNDGVGLSGLKREATIARYMRHSLGERADLVCVLEWNFDFPPYYLETEYAGENLLEWAEHNGGLGNIPLQTRIAVLIDIAKSVAAAHDIGVLHKDLKPGNVLLQRKENTDWCVRVGDFGSASLTEPSRLAELGITNLGFTRTATADDKSLTGTLMYIAPEVLAGQSPTASGDVYALGIMLYQLITGDFRRPLSAGWEGDIADPLIREDIAGAACGDPALRMKTAAGLAQRLEALEERRTRRAELEFAAMRTAIAEQRIARSRAQRPWIVAAVLALTVGLTVSLFLYRQAALARDRANHQTEIAAAVNRFLANDLLGRSNPFQSGRADESLLDAVKQASPNIDRQFRRAPEVAARLHHAIGRALDNRTDYVDARPEYARAAALFEQQGGPLSQDAIMVQLQRVAAEARSYQNGSLSLAKSILAEQEKRIAKIPQPTWELLVWLANARGMIALIDNNVHQANVNFGEAFERSGKVTAFDATSRLLFKQRLAFTYIRLGDGAKAAQLFRELIDAFTRTDGPDSPNVLRVRLNLAQAFMVQQKYTEAIQETTRIYPMYVAKLGQEHELTMQVLSTRAACEGALGRYEDSIHDDLKIYELAGRTRGDASYFAIGTLSDAALAQCRGGHLKDGVVNARKAYVTALNGFGARAGLTGGAAHTLAECLIEQGNVDEAAKLLQNIDTKAVAQLTGSNDWPAALELSKAQIAFRRGDYDLARKHLVLATPLFSRADAEPYQRKKVQELASALNR
jgi:DNA-binding winged helix-turn-helix (wHTH) protein/serine/threonine protein kinase